MLLSLLACVALSEGDYAVDYRPPSEDDCGLYGDEDPRDDETVTIARLGADLRWERETGEDLVWRVAGETFSRTSEGTIPLDSNCGFITEISEEGRVTSPTSFSGTTTVLATLEADCGAWTEVFGTRCTVVYPWEGEVVP